MQVVRGSKGMRGDEWPCAVGIGIFDGVHRGHQSLLLEAKRLASCHGLYAVAYTFDPHPARVLRPELAPRAVQPLEARIERLASLGLDGVVVEPFTPAFAKMDTQSFAEEILVGRLRARHVVVGADFRFGAGQEGDVAELGALGRRHGFKVHAVALVRTEGIVVSSTKVREFVRNGKMRGATLLLGRPFSVSGQVVRGAGRGAGLGFATANLRVGEGLVPGVGVYAARAYGVVGEAAPAVVNVGFAPTFGKTGLKIEAHVLDYQGGPLYGSVLTLDFLQRIRDEHPFEDPEQLEAQIAADVTAARKILRAAEHNPPPTV